MKKVQYIAVSAAVASVMSVGVMGLASAATTTNTNVGSSGIPRSVFHEERQAAVASVLGTSAASIEAAHKDHTFEQLLSKAGLTKDTFHEKVKAALTSDLEAKGYSQQQVTIALQQRDIHHFKHEHSNRKHNS